MKRNSIQISASLITLLLLTVSIFTVSCSDNDSEGGGQPVITGVRVTDPELADSLFTKSAPGQTIAIIGKNLSGALEVYVNDQFVDFNPVFNTDHSIIISIPSEADGFLLSAYNEGIKDEIKVITSHGTAVYAFKVTADYPVIQRIKASYPRETGDEVLVYGTGLVDIEKMYVTDILPDEVKALVAANQPIGGNHVDVSDYSYKVKDNIKVVKNNKTTFEKNTVMAFNLPNVPYEQGTLVIEAAGGITYIAYNKYPGLPTIKYLSTDMPVIGETVTLVGNEYVDVESITYGDVTITGSDLNVYESEDTIQFVFNKKPSVGTEPVLTLTTPGGSVSKPFYNYSTLLIDFDGKGMEIGWSPTPAYETATSAAPPFTSDGKFAHLVYTNKVEQWWGTMIWFAGSYAWEGNNMVFTPYTLPGYDVIPEDASTKNVYIAMEVFNNNSDFNPENSEDATVKNYQGFIRYSLWNANNSNLNSSTVDYDNFEWADYNAGTFRNPVPVLADVKGDAPLGCWYRHVVPLSSFSNYASRTYGDVVRSGINMIRLMSLSFGTNTGNLDVSFDNIRIIYIPNE